MHFDHIIMNPSYKGSLHLKILDKVIKACPNAEIVNLSPASQLFAPKRLIKKHPFIVSHPELERHIECVDFLKPEEASKLFDASFASELMIIKYNPKVAGKSTAELNMVKPEFRSIFDKTVRAVHEGKYISLLDKIKEYDGHQDSRKFSLTVPEVHGHQGKNDFYEIASSNYERALKSKQRFGWHLEFDTEEERKNCWAAWHLKSHQFIHSLIKIDNFNMLAELPYLGDYTHPWTDEMLYNYFDLTEDEIKEIENAF